MIALVALTTAVIVWLWLGVAIDRCSDGVRRVEEEINRRIGEDLLQWESGRRGTTFHWFHKWWHPRKQA